MKSYLTKREQEIVQYLFAIVKDTTDYFNEIKKETKLTEEELKDFKCKFLKTLTKALNAEAEIDRILNHQKDIETQNIQLQSALLEANKILDDIKDKLDNCCDTCSCVLKEYELNTGRITFKDILAEIDRIREPV